MPGRKPVVVLPDGLGELPATDALLLAIFGLSGIVQGVKVWLGTTQTTTLGAWSVDLTAAGFSPNSTPAVIPTALSAGSALASSASAILVGASPTQASGYVNVPAAIAVGGLGVQRAGSGITVTVLALGL